eukprot:501116_1
MCHQILLLLVLLSMFAYCTDCQNVMDSNNDGVLSQNMNGEGSLVGTWKVTRTVVGGAVKNECGDAKDELLLIEKNGWITYGFHSRRLKTLLLFEAKSVIAILDISNPKNREQELHFVVSLGNDGKLYGAATSHHDPPFGSNGVYNLNGYRVG